MDSPYFCERRKIQLRPRGRNQLQTESNKVSPIQRSPIPKSYYAYGVANCYACRFFAVLRKTLILCQKGVAFCYPISSTKTVSESQ